MRSTLLSLLGMCSHRRTTFPLSPVRRLNSRAYVTAPRPYVVCLDCGKEFEYDWDYMKIGPQIKPVAPQPNTALTVEQ